MTSNIIAIPEYRELTGEAGELQLGRTYQLAYERAHGSGLDDRR